MRNSGKKVLGILGIIFCLFLAATLVAPDDALCRGSSSSSTGSSGRSYSPPRSYSTPRSYSPPKSTVGRSGGWGAKTAAPTAKSEVGKSGGWGAKTSAPTAKSEVGKSGGWGLSQKPDAKTPDSRTALSGTRGGTASVKAAPSKVDKAFAEKAKMKGTSFKSRDAAVKEFQAKNAAKYTARFSNEPVTRPSYIPQTTMYNGRSVTVVYNPMYGGYGYMYGGSWIMYDAMRDVAMMNLLMHNHGYYYGQPMAFAYGLWHLFWTLVIIGVIIGLIVFAVKRLQ